MLIVYSVILLISFYFIAKICDDYFVESLDKIAHRLNLSSDAAGATLMAIGSSAPELMVAVFSVIMPGDHEAIGMGSIVGSAIFNVLVITGVVGIVKQFDVVWHIITRDLSFYLLSVLFLFYVFIDGEISLVEAIIFISMYIFYVITVVNWKKIIDFKSEEKIEEPEEEETNKWLNFISKPVDFILDKVFFLKSNYMFTFLVSIGLISFFSWVLVESAIGVAAILEIPEAFVAITVLAVGTSIPDLLSSVIVGKQSRGGMAVSNAIGSNVFDILIGLGIPFIIMIALNGGKVEIETSGLISSTILLIISIVFMFLLLIINKWNIGKKMGGVMVFIYVAFLVWQVIELL